ncbi:MAG: FAD-dependent oxidoreductase [Flavobacteriales bacterium]|nr:FAD-dependent oxidoreductase [Flavobacteriales bacterium]
MGAVGAEEVDVVVIGAGPAGTVASAYLARKGRRTVVIEREKFPRFVIGESLLPVSMEHWEETGLLPALDSQGYAPKLGARFMRGDSVLDLSFSEQFTKGYGRTWQVPRDHFDKTCADAAAAQGVDIRYESTITAVEHSETGPQRVQVSGPTGGATIKCRWIIDTSGYGGALTRLLDLPFQRVQAGRVSLFTQVKESHRDRFPDPMQISFDVLEQDLWFWVIPFSNGNTSIGFVGGPDHFQGHDPAVQFKALLKRTVRFRDRFQDLPHLFGPELIRDYTHAVERLSGPGFVLAGNCAGFLDPVFSSGVALATSSGLRAAKLTDRSLQGERIDWRAEYEVPFHDMASVFRSYIDSWYNGDLQTIFFSDRMDPRIKSQIVSVLAGYVEDRSNPFVSRHDHILGQLAGLIKAGK